MMDLDRVVRETLAQRASSIPSTDRVATRVLAKVADPRARRLRVWVAPATAAASVVAVLVVAHLVGGFPVLDSSDAPSGPGATGTVPTAQSPPLDELTGKAVGLALGLTPDEEGDDVGDCSGWYAEYAESEAGFCLAGVTDDPVREMVLALQIQGYAPTDTVKAFAAAYVEYDNPQHGALAERGALLEKVSDLHQQLAAQGRVAEQN